MEIIASKEQFEKEILNSKDDIPCMVDFWAKWCGPCRMMTPVVEELAHRYKGQIKVFKLNIDQVDDSVSSSQGVEGIPAFIFYKNGKETHRVTGAFMDDLENAFSTIVGENLQ